VFRIYVVTFSLVLLLVGCATNEDLQRMRQDLEARLVASEAKQTEQVKKELSALRKELEQSSGWIGSLRKAEADTKADITELRDQIRRLRGNLESLQREVAVLQNKAVEPKEIKDIRERIEQINTRLNFLENFLGIGKSEGGIRQTPGISPKGKTEKEAIYASAYENFRAGRYQEARQEFQSYLKAYPQSEYAANAQFWIAECYFNEKNYEQAVLEYEKVIANYPGSNKLPYALLKQGLAFLQLGDKTSARAIFQTIIKDYPNTNQASIARAKLLEMK